MERMNFFAKSGNAMKALSGFPVYLSKCSIDSKLQHLIFIRVSMINGCSYCLDMHTKDLRLMGETEQRMLLLGAWREAFRIYTAKRTRCTGLGRSCNTGGQCQCIGCSVC